ncbi:MAG: hypothetical protein HQL63_12000 [Magnetococcales bacterium]|nr:hypothetical protein [Magnetococcales bacterium]
MFSLEAWASLPPVVALFLIIRLFPYWHLRQRGCDPYFFLLFADPLRPENPRENPECAAYAILLKAESMRTLRRGMRQENAPSGMAATSPTLLPGLPFLLSWLPWTWLRQTYWLINHLLDALCMTALFLLVRSELGNWLGYLVALLYALSPALNSEFCRLTSRSLAMPFFLLVLGNTFSWLQSDHRLAFWISVASCLVLFRTHHLTVRVLLFVMPFLGMTLQDMRWPLPMLLACLLVAFVDRRLFLTVLGYPWSQAPLREGHLLSLNGSCFTAQTRATSLLSGMTSLRMLFRRHYRQAKVVFLMNPAALAVVIFFTDRPPHYDLVHLMIYWVMGVYLLVGFSLLFPVMRRMGIRLNVVQYAEWPSLFVTVLYLVKGGTSVQHWLLLALFPLLHVLNYAVRLFWLRQAGPAWCGMETPALLSLMERITRLERARILCFPAILTGLTAYRTGKAVLWPSQFPGIPGDESLGAVLALPVTAMAHTSRVTHLLLDQTYLTLVELGLPESGVQAREGHFLLYAFQPEPIAN